MNKTPFEKVFIRRKYYAHEDFDGKKFYRSVRIKSKGF